MSAATTAPPLALYLAGSCAQLVDELGDAFANVVPGVDVTAARVAHTGVIAAEVLAGAPADIVLSANVAYIEALQDGGLVPAPRPFARNRLALFVHPNAADRVRSLADLTRDDVRMCMPPPELDPCGAYTVELFARAGLTDQMVEQLASGRLTVLTERGPSMSELLAHGDIDALIAYRTIAPRLPQFQLIEVPAPLDLRDRIVFTTGAVVRDGQTHPAAAAFIELLCGDAGWAILDRHDFLAVS